MSLGSAVGDVALLGPVLMLVWTVFTLYFILWPNSEDQLLLLCHGTGSRLY